MFNLFRNKRLDDKLFDVETDYNNLLAVIENFKKGSKYPINRDSLELFPVLKWVDLGGGIKIRKRKNRFKSYLNFDTEMEQGAEFGKHFHDDIIESCEVINGLLYDKLTDKFYRAGDVAHYERGETHQPVAVQKSFLHVLFK